METTEKIIESYYRLCKNALTYTDVKYIKGNNRQLDILAYSPSLESFWHVESSISILENFTLTIPEIRKRFKEKFLGNVKDHKKGKQSFKESLTETYALFGASWKDVTRVWVQWHYESRNELEALRAELAGLLNVKPDKIEFLSLRDDIITHLYEKVGTSKYDDDFLRTLSLLKRLSLQRNDSVLNSPAAQKALTAVTKVKEAFDLGLVYSVIVRKENGSKYKTQGIEMRKWHGKKYMEECLAVYDALDPIRDSNPTLFKALIEGKGAEEKY